MQFKTGFLYEKSPYQKNHLKYCSSTEYHVIYTIFFFFKSYTSLVLLLSHHLIGAAGSWRKSGHILYITDATTHLSLYGKLWDVTPVPAYLREKQTKLLIAKMINHPTWLKKKQMDMTNYIVSQWLWSLLLKFYPLSSVLDTHFVTTSNKPDRHFEAVFEIWWT